MTTKPTKLSRRTFLQSSAGAMAVPLIAPSHLFGQRAPSNVLRIGAIGTGRMGTGDMQAVAKQGLIEGVDAHVVAVCDLDQTRVRSEELARQALQGQAAGRRARRRRLPRLPRTARA